MQRSLLRYSQLVQLVQLVHQRRQLKPPLQRQDRSQRRLSYGACLKKPTFRTPEKSVQLRALRNWVKRLAFTEMKVRCQKINTWQMF
jgi:hypothetical protein